MVGDPRLRGIERGMADVFISYKKEDRELVERVSAALGAYKLTVWWDDSLESGQGFRGVIKDELRKARAVIVLWTKKSVVSDWVLDEADFAKNAGKLVPLRFASDFDVPLGFGQVQVANLEGWLGAPDDPRFARVAERIGGIAEHGLTLIAQAIGPNLRSGAETSVRVSGALWKSLTQAEFLGLPLGRFVWRGLVASALLAVIIAQFSYPSDTRLTLSTRLMDGFTVAAPYFFIMRGLHQYIMFKKGASSRLAFDPPFRFWIWISGLLATMYVAISVDVVNPMNIARALPLSSMLAFGGVMIARFLISFLSSSPTRGVSAGSVH